MTSFLDVTEHRPWPLPSRPWVGHMRWDDLAFCHWPVDAAVLRPMIPAGLALDLFDGQAWLGIVPFRMEDVRVRFLPPVPTAGSFPELNVRTYVRAGDRAGVWFFSLDAASALAVRGARAMYNLPYFDAAMEAESHGDRVSYRTDRVHAGAPPASFRARYGPAGEVYQARKGTLDHFLAERYCLFNVDRAGEVGFMDIHHAPWPLQPGVAEIAVNTMAAAAGIALPDAPPLVHFVRSLEVVAWTHEPLRQ